MNEYNFDAILLIDDDDATNFYNEIMLEEWELANEIHISTNGRKGLDFLKENENGFNQKKNALILLDINMPIMDGFQFLDAFASLPIANKENLSIVMLSSSSHPMDIEKANKYTFLKGFMSKPLEKENLLACFA